MAWQTPKIDWSPEDGVLNSDFNRIEGNLQYLYDNMPSQALASVVLYVTEDGNDATGDGSAAAPFTSIQEALDSLPKALGGNDVSIVCGSGTYMGFELTNFKGGTVTITSVNADVYIDGNVLIDNCDAVSIIGFGALIVYGSITVRNSILRCTDNVTISNSRGLGLIVEQSKVAFTYSFTVTSSTSASGILADYNSEVFVESLLIMPGTGTGITADRGGKVAYSSVSNRADVETHIARGGRVYTGS
jgi:hypothetical protein